MAGYLIDSGSILSVVPPTQNERNHPDPPSHFLHAANGSLIKNYGKRTETFRILGYSCKDQMTVADVTTPILGFDFFNSGDGQKFVIDLSQQCLRDRNTVCH